jgi:hypothetical protein
MASKPISYAVCALLLIGAGCITTEDESLGAVQHEADSAVPEAVVSIALDAGHELDVAPGAEHEAATTEPDVGTLELDAADDAVAPRDSGRDAAADAADAHAPDAGHDAGRSLECRLEPWECR